MQISKLIRINANSTLKLKNKHHDNLKFNSLSTLMDRLKNLTGFLSTAKSEEEKNNNASSISETNSGRRFSFLTLRNGGQTKIKKSKFLRTMNSSSTSNTKTRLSSSSPETESAPTALHTTPNIPTSKKQLLASIDDLDGDEIFMHLDFELDELIKHFNYLIKHNSNSFSENQQTSNQATNFLETSEISPIVYLKLSEHGKHLLKRSHSLNKDLIAAAPLFDYKSNEAMNINGYRSLSKVYENSCRRLLIVVNDLNEKKKSFLFVLKFNLPVAINTALKEFQTWVRIIEKLEFFLKMALKMQKISLESEISKSSALLSTISNNEPTLFIDSDRMIESNIELELFKSSVNNLEDFFGRACGFQFCDSLQLPMAACTIALASYNDGYGVSTSAPSQISPTATAAQATTSSSSSLMRSSTATTSTQVISSQNTQFSTSISLGQAAKSLFSSTKYLMDPDFRAKKVANVFKNADVEFCKAFWQLTENSIISKGSNLIMPNVAINLIKKLYFHTLRLPRVTQTKTTVEKAVTTETTIKSAVEMTEKDFVEIKAPSGCSISDYVQIRILSADVRDGMRDLDKFESIVKNSSPSTNNMQPLSTLSYSSTSASSSSRPKSSSLILHAHGGGFIAHSSRSHEIYLRPWCKDLRVPIVSIDYSLAPEYPFPRASEECFYVYAWCLLNKSILGWTGERIICVGDSAGGVLVTNITQRAIDNEIRIPDALVPIYTPFLLTYSLSPSRLLSIMDPVLNIAILWRCLAAYCGVDIKAETEAYKLKYNLGSLASSSSSSSLSPNAVTSESKNGSQATFFNRLSQKYFKESSSSNSSQAKLDLKATNDTNTNMTSISVDAKFIDEMSDLEEKENIAYASKQFSAPSAKFMINNDSDDECTSYNENESKDKNHEIKNKIVSKNEDFNLLQYKKERKRLLELHEMIGDSVFLIDKLRQHKAPLNPYMSPLLCPDSTLKKFPKTYLITASRCPLLDDSVEMLKRMKENDVQVSLSVLEGLHHGFLNFISVSKDSHTGYEEVTRIIRQEIDADMCSSSKSK